MPRLPIVMPCCQVVILTLLENGWGLTLWAEPILVGGGPLYAREVLVTSAGVGDFTPAGEGT